jgi:hypothetical protein
MNIFFLDEDPKKAAIAHGDKHCNKMILETAQMLCTAHRLLNEESYAEKHRFYKKAFQNHPCTIWVRETKQNYVWAHRLMMALCSEFKLRRNKLHASTKLLFPLAVIPPGIAETWATPVAQAMPEEFKNKNPVIAYRQYYRYKVEQGKVDYNWGREAPDWLETNCPPKKLRIVELEKYGDSHG